MVITPISNFVEQSDVRSFMNGTSFPTRLEKYLKRDDIFVKLTTHCELDDETVRILNCAFSSFSTLTKRLVKDHLPGGKHNAFTERHETALVLKHNKLSEETFAHIDRAFKIMPNANVITAESQVIYRKNKVGKWLGGLEEKKKEGVITKSRRQAVLLKKNEKTRGEEIAKAKKEKLEQRIREETRRRENLFRKKEAQMSDIDIFGLWQTEQQVFTALSSLKNKGVKIDAVKAQISE